MENFLKQIVDNTEPKRSFSIVVSDNKTQFKTWFKPPIQLDKKRDFEMCLSIRRCITNFQIYIDPTIVLIIHLVLAHHGLTLLFQKVIITLKISMSSLNEKSEIKWSL